MCEVLCGQTGAAVSSMPCFSHASKSPHDHRKHNFLDKCPRWVRPSFIFAIRASPSEGLLHSSFDIRCVSDPAAPTAPASASPGPRPSPAPARTPRSSPPSRGGARARVGVLPPHNRAHRRVRLQRRCINANPLPPQQPTIRQQLQHPAEHLLMRLHIDQPPRARNRRMIRCLLV